MRWIWVLYIAGIVAAAPPKAKPVDLALTDSEGRKVHLKDDRGKLVVLNFWATWCGPCKAEMPLLVSAEENYRSRGVVFIAASLDDPKTQARIPDFVNQYAVKFTVWTGASGDDLDRLRMGEAVPATAFIDKDGSIVARVSGQIREEELRQRIDWLLSDRSTPPPEAQITHLGK